MKRILVAGGAGFIGSHVNKMLHLAGYDTVILDNLSTGNQKAVTHGVFIQGDIGNTSLLQSIFQKYSIRAVMHFAAYIDVGESFTNPAKYYENNVAKTLTLLETMQRHQIKFFIFSSSAAVYGNPIQNPLSESHPCNPINPYGRTKLMVEQALQDLTLKSVSLRYFNAAGGDPSGQIKNYKQKESNLIPIILESLKTNGTITINGTDYPTPDGTCVRDYIDVNDLASAHILAMERLFSGGATSIYNLGNGRGFSIQEVISSVEKVTGLKVQYMKGPRRVGDPPILVSDASKAINELGWKPQYPSLDAMIEHAWKAKRDLMSKE